MFKITNKELRDIMKINTMKEKLNKYLLGVIIFLSSIILIQSIAIVYFFIAKKQIPYLVFYSKADQNFVKIQEANQEIKNSDAVKWLLLSTYVDKRESINRVNDIQKLEDIKNQSNNETWNELALLIKNKDSISNNNAITREVKIINISYITNNIAQVYFILTQFNHKEQDFIKQYRATIQYEFREQETSFAEMPKNPLGFFVTKYGLSEIKIPEISGENK